MNNDTTINLANKAKLAKKLLNVTKSIDSVKKSGVNKYAKYVYLTLRDILESVRKHLISEGVVLLTSVENVEMVGDITNLKVKYTFIDTDTGEELFVYGAGSAKDSQGFGTPKALTIAQKIMFEKVFLIPTHDDPEAEHANPSYTKDSSKTSKTASTTKTPTTTSKSFLNKNTIKKELNTEVKEPMKKVVKPNFGRISTKATKEPSFP